jgi:hypothetical protein
MHVGSIWRLSHNSVQFICCNKLSFTLVPRGENLFKIINLMIKGLKSFRLTNLGRWSAAQDPGMNQACKFDVGDMAGGTVDTLKVLNSKSPD